MLVRKKARDLWLSLLSSGTESFSEIPCKASGIPRCVVRQRDLDLYIDHFSEWWIVAYMRRYFIGKRVICTPYVPISIIRNAKYLLYLCITDENRGIPKKLLEETFYHLTHQKEVFGLNTDKIVGSRLFVRYNLKQCIEEDIKFHVDIKDSHNEMIHPTSSSIADRPETMGRTASSAALKLIETSSKPRDEEEEMLSRPAHPISPASPEPPEQTQVQETENREDIGEDSGVIRLEKHDIEVRIPPDEAYGAKDVTVTVIGKVPPELVLKETEAIISVGLKMSPSYATFDSPVKVTIPHSGAFTKPEAAEIVIYHRRKAAEEFTPIPSTSGTTRCVERHRDLDLYMHLLSEIWIIAATTRVFTGKRVICTPYIPVSTPMNEDHVLFVRIKDTNSRKEEVEDGYVAPISGEQFLVRWGSGNLRITCPESTMKTEARTIQESEIRHLTEHKVMFTVDRRTADMPKVILNFKLEQSTTKHLKVPMHLREPVSDIAGLDSKTETTTGVPADEVLQKLHVDEKEGRHNLLSVREIDGAESTEMKEYSSDRGQSAENFDNSGGELTIPAHGLTLTIPPGALEEGRRVRISVEVLKNIPPGLTLRDDEMLVTQGFQFLPSGLQFTAGNPARLKIPHCVNLIDPQKVQVVLYSWDDHGEPERIVQTSRTCRVTPHHIEISLEHFSKEWLAFIRDFLFMKSKMMSFMPFLPKSMPPTRKFTLEFRMVNNPHETSNWRDIHEISEKAEHWPAKDGDDVMKVKDENMRITCQLNDSYALEENIDSSFFDKPRHTVYFVLDFKGLPDTLPVHLMLQQSSPEMKITFFTKFSSLCATETDDGFGGTERADASRASRAEAQIPTEKQLVSDADVLKLSKRLSPSLFYELASALGINYSIAEGIREKTRDVNIQYMHLLQKWKAESPHTRANLDAILQQAGVGGLAKKYYSKTAKKTALTVSMKH